MAAPPQASGAMSDAVAEAAHLLEGLAITLFRGNGAEKSLPSAAPSLPRDLYVFGIFATAIFSINWGLRLMFVKPMVKAFLPIRAREASKFSQSFMEFLVYGIFSWIGFMVLRSQEWCWPSSLWWIGFADGGHEVMRSDMRAYYILYAARYFQAAFSTMMEARRKDFWEMQIHHWATVIVIYISYVYGWNRVGCVVMLLLDPADVPLHLAKLSKYLGDGSGNKVFKVTADRLFEFFAVVFFVTRLVMYPYVCWSCHIEATRYFPKGPPEWACVALLETLMALQIYWFWLLMKVAIRMARGAHVADERSDDEGDEAEPSNGTKKEQ